MDNIDVVVINLEKDKDRLHNIKKQLNKLNIPFTRQEAVYGKKLSDKEIEDNTTLVSRKILIGKSTVGCAMSHIEAWKKFLDSGKDFICVLEDDADILDNNFKEFLSSIPKIYNKTDFEFLSLINFGICFNKGEKITVDDYSFYRPFLPTTTTGYILSRKGVEKILKNIKKVSYHIDIMLAILIYTDDLNYWASYNTIVNGMFENNKSNITSKNRTMLSTVLDSVNIKPVNKLNWLLNSVGFVVNMKYDISFYSCILVILIIYFICKKKRFIATLLLIELLLSVGIIKI